MKKTISRIASPVAAALMSAVLLLVPSCKSEPEPLTLFGEWQEKGFPAYDTLASSSQSRLVLECASQVHAPQGQNAVKEGDFSLFIKSVHLPSYSSPERYTYTEYVKGTYRLDETEKSLAFDGIYYTDSLFQTVATDSNTRFSFGSYQRNTFYQLNDLTLTLGLSDSIPTDINTFYPVELRSNCY